MLRHPVSSSELRSIRYDEITEMLEVELVTGELYQFFGVTQTDFTALMAAPSHGAYFHEQIEGRHVTRRVW